MFTGLVQELGTVRSIELHAAGALLQIQAASVLQDAKAGDSIALNGCCLTIVARGSDWWQADVVEETLRRTCLGALDPGERVNLERPLRLSDRLDGHLVQGHVDGIGVIRQRSEGAERTVEMEIGCSPSVLRYVVEKGSIAVDGISLTVTTTREETFGLALIPHTLSMTTLGIKQIGALVNLEVDLLAKYVERLLLTDAGSPYVRTIVKESV